jgi:peptide/nickel transport system permease protein
MSKAWFHFALTRTLSGLAVLAGICLLVFFLIHLVPGDPVDAMLGETAPPVERQRLREALHLDEPLTTQLGRFVSSLADGTMGRSFRHPNRTVTSLIFEVYPRTLELALASMAVALILALPLGIAAALRPHSPVDFMATGISLLGISIPNLYLGPLLLLVFYIHLGWFPGPAPDDPSSLSALVLPAITLGTALMAMLARMTRASLLDVLSEDFIRTARAKGLSPTTVVLKHGLRNALIPIISVAGLQFGALLSGAIVTEKIFARPGIGTLLLSAIASRDYPLIQGCVLTIAGSYVIINALTDLSYGLADPRIRLGASGRG